MEERIKIVTHITPEANKKVEAFMKYSGMTKAKVCSLAIISGIDVFTIATDPNWIQYLEVQARLQSEAAKK